VKRGERTVVRSGLVLDAGAEYLQGRAAPGDQSAGPAAEHRAAECRRSSMVAAEQAGRNGLEVVHQDRRLHGRVQPQQQVDVVGLAIELSELAAPALEKATKGGAQFVEHRGAEAATTALWH